jgi:hypothetical protein
VHNGEDPATEVSVGISASLASSFCGW